MDGVDLGTAGAVALDLAGAIVRDEDRLSEPDGAAGDGDRGVDTAKGFRPASAGPDRLGVVDPATGLWTLGDTLLGDTGGSMGPPYGTFVTDMADSVAARLGAPA